MSETELDRELLDAGAVFPHDAPTVLVPRSECPRCHQHPEEIGPPVFDNPRQAIGAFAGALALLGLALLLAWATH